MRRASAIVIITGTALGFLAAVGTAWFCEFRFNLTPSEPLGLWRIILLNRPARNGDLVFVCPPESTLFHKALERGYLRRGLCRGGYAPLIKSVVAEDLPRLSCQVRMIFAMVCGSFSIRANCTDSR
ncbi:hypothetical protein [Phyllobacterium ifriqiyense]|uniref:hypothetical protein n=1 Tax=Phyllobacterium ifriqiyense TaxID=314238 RepID=UPI0033934141